MPTKVGLPGSVLSTAAPSETIVVTVELAGGSDCVSTPSDVIMELSPEICQFSSRNFSKIKNYL